MAHRAERQGKRKTIGTKINNSIAMVMIPSLIVLIVVSCLMAASAVSKLNQTVLEAQADNAANQVDDFFKNKVTSVSMFQFNTRTQMYAEATKGEADIAAYDSLDAQVALLKETYNIMKEEGVEGVWVVGKDNGCYLMQDGEIEPVDFNTVDWDEKVNSSNKTIITEPFYDTVTGKIVLCIVSPVYGLTQDGIVGYVGFDVYEDSLAERLSQLKIGKEGFLDLISSDNKYIYSIDDTIIDKSVSEVSGLGANFTSMISNNQTGKVVYDYEGTRYNAIIQDCETNDWLAVANIPTSEVNATRNQLVLILGGIAIVILIMLIAILYYIIAKVTRPIKELTEGVEEFSSGNLKIEMDVHTDDEIGVLADSVRKTIHTQQEIINNISYLLGEMSRGNLKLEVTGNYIGDFHPIQEALLQIIEALNSTLGQISQSAGQVSLGSGQMAESAQSLAEGATDQAGAIEELQASITDVTEQVEETAALGRDAYSKALEIEKEAEVSSQEMGRMTEAMSQIQETSRQIAGIIAQIEDIATQTNLLSLNAAIEAARAGEAGRGFAVVADQIRKLAEDSGKSAVNTRELIESSIREVDKGNEITAKTAQSMNNVIEGMNLIADSVRKSSKAAENQAESMQQIRQGIEQISGVVQSNSAVAEETSATSEELSAQAVTLDELVGRFTLKEE